MQSPQITTHLGKNGHSHSIHFFSLTGFVYGAKKGKTLNVFIDDLSVPEPDEHGVQEVNEVNTQKTKHNS